MNAQVSGFGMGNANLSLINRRRRQQNTVDNWWKRNFGTTPHDGGGLGKEQGVELQSMRYPWGSGY